MADDLAALFESAGQMGGGEALVYMTLKREVVTVVQSGHIMGVDWRGLDLSGEISQRLLDLPWLNELDLRNNELTFREGNVERLKGLGGLDKMGLGQTDQIEALVAFAQALDKDKRFAIDSMGGLFGRDTLVEDGKVLEVRVCKYSGKEQRGAKRR